MPRSPEEMVRYLKKNGFKKVKSGHQKMKNFAKNLITEVPMHSGDLDKGTEHAILRQAKLK